MNKQDIISRFEIACTSPNLVKTRQCAVESQFQRGVLELFDGMGLIRIRDDAKGSNMEQLFTIEVFSTIEYVQTYGEESKWVMFFITNNEYTLLKKRFYGTFKANQKYLRKIGAIE